MAEGRAELFPALQMEKVRSGALQGGLPGSPFEARDSALRAVPCVLCVQLEQSWLPLPNAMQSPESTPYVLEELPNVGLNLDGRRCWRSCPNLHDEVPHAPQTNASSEHPGQQLSQLFLARNPDDSNELPSRFCQPGRMNERERDERIPVGSRRSSGAAVEGVRRSREVDDAGEDLGWKASCDGRIHPGRSGGKVSWCLRSNAWTLLHSRWLSSRVHK